MDCQNRPEPFDTIESAQEFLALLSQSICQTMGDVDDELRAAVAGSVKRRAQALELTCFKLKQLRSHVVVAEKLLKDLRTLRDLLCKDAKATSSARQAELADSVEPIGIG